MKKRGYVINYILLLVCILASLSQVESYKITLGQTSYFDAQSIIGLPCGSTAAEENIPDTSSLKKIDCIVSADACTVEMLEGTRSNLLNRTSAIRRNEIREKAGSRSQQAEGICAWQRSNQFYIFANLCAKTIGTDTAGVIRFIHNKDGKKKI